jgi:serine O-acetyltransferase
VLYQGVTVGRHKDQIPVIGDRVVLYPNSAVAGRAVVEDDCVISQGTRVINKVVPKGSLVFAGERPGELAFRPRPDDLLSEYFRL